MRNHRNALLAGFATLPLIAGAGLASAQDQSQDQKGAQHEMNKAPAAGKTDHSAQDQDRNSGGRMQKSNQLAQQTVRGNKPATANDRNNRMSQSRQWAKTHTARTEHDTAAMERQNNIKGATAEREHKGLEGLQANASGMNVRLNDEQRTQIRETVIDARGAPGLDNPNFNVTVGTAIPQTGVRIVPVPQTLVRIEPMWRSYRYFVWMDDVVIVNPRDMTIVAVIRA